MFAMQMKNCRSFYRIVLAFQSVGRSPTPPERPPPLGFVFFGWRREAGRGQGEEAGGKAAAGRQSRSVMAYEVHTCRDGCVAVHSGSRLTPACPAQRWRRGMGLSLFLVAHLLDD